MSLAALPDRALLAVTGADAENFLQGLITTDLGALTVDEVRPGALLTPQGKILFAFLISRIDGGFRLDTTADQAPALLKRLTLYKLRAAVTLAQLAPTPVGVSAEPRPGALRDVRFETAGTPLFRLYGEDGAGDAAAYDAHRIALGIAEPGADYALQDAFPHDVLLDKDGGLSFRKGCYVGQEVVSRMQHRGTARRRVVTVEAESPLPTSGTELTAGGKTIGTLGSVLGRRGLAIVRVDKVGDALATGMPVLAGELPVTLALPAWTGLSFPTDSADEAQGG